VKIRLASVVVVVAAALATAAMTGGPAAASSKHPSTGRGSTAAKWKLVTLTDPNKLVTVTCATVHLCVAVDFAGNALVSTNPAGGPSAWKLTDIDGTTSLTGISCPTVHLCVAVDGSGNAIVSTNPTGGTAAWVTNEVDTTFYNSLDGVSCPSAKLCVAVDTSGNAVTSTNPSGGASAWATTAVDPEPSGGNPDANSIEAISCPNSTLCVAGDFSGNVLTSTNPTGGAAAWTLAPVDSSGGLGIVSCLSAHLCLAVGTNDVWHSTAPAGGTSQWAKAKLQVPPVGLACPSTKLCVAEDVATDILSTTHPTGSAKTWGFDKSVGTQNHLEGGVACPTTRLCVAVGEDDVLTSTNP